MARGFSAAVQQVVFSDKSTWDGSAVPWGPLPEAAIVTKPRLALVKQAGKQYAETGEIDAALLAEIGSPMIPEEQYAAIVNGGV